MSAPVSTAGEARSECISRKRVAGGLLALALLLAAAAALALPLAAAAPATASPLLSLSPHAALLATLQGTFTGQSASTLCDQMGSAVAVSGDTALVGAQYYQDTTQNPVPQHRGRVYVFTRASGAWTQQQILTAPDETDVSYFGCSVALEGDTAVIGANGHAGTSGSVYIFTRSGGAWTFQQRLDGPTHSALGYSLAIDGDTLIAGAVGYYATDLSPQQGAAVVYTRAGGTWSKQQLITADDGADGDRFGWSVGVSGDAAIVGAPARNGGVANGDGAAYVFTRSSGVWSQQREIVGSSLDNLGRAVAISGTTALAGAPRAGSYAGKVVVLADTGSGWAKQTEFAAPDSLPSDTFGWAVAMSGGEALIGASSRTVGGQSWAGEVYAYSVAAAALTEQGTFDAPTPASQYHFGTALALDGSTALVGAPYAPDLSSGHAYAYLLSSGGDATPPVTVAHVSPAGWTNQPVTVTLTATDDSPGLITTVYKVQGAASWLPYAAPFVVTTQGITTYVCHSTDAAANLETPDVVFTVRRDTLGPGTLALANVKTRFGKSASFRYRVNDLTPSATVWIKIFKGRKLKKTAKLGSQTTNEALSYRWKCGLARGTYTWKVSATDQAGNTQRTMTGKKLTVK